ncbi:MAG: DUF4920 domain-containing protein [Flavobacteriales bacterium]|nr:MAG: DUF4920 domain-containing protein [Flavobacteriales bacterium]
MKKRILLLSIFTLLFACKTEHKKELSYLSFGREISNKEILSNDQVVETYKNLKVGDTINMKFSATVNEVCQVKGCWMLLDIGAEEAMVKFKDYGFFMPKNIVNKEVIVNGKAFVSEISVDEQRHYAEDAGKSDDEIAKIIEVKKTLSLEADGVLLIE